MRKFVMLTATAAMALSLSACKGKEEAPAAETAATSEAAPADASAAPAADASAAPAASEAAK